MALAAGARDPLAFEREDGEAVAQPPRRLDRVEARGQGGVLRGDPGGVAPRVPVVTGIGGRAERGVIGGPFRVALAISAAVPMATASAPRASALATSAPVRMPPETTSCTCRCIPRS